MLILARMVVVIVTGLIALTPALAQAFAPSSAIHKAGRVLGKLDPLENPSYPDNFFLLPDGRLRLSNDVAAVLTVLLNGGSTADWCSPIVDIGDNPARYFDVSRSPNDAPADFQKDWFKVATAPNCA